jgi:hypothetical protein
LSEGIGRLAQSVHARSDCGLPEASALERSSI